MVKITPLNNYCVLNPQGPLAGDDFTAIANQIDPKMLAAIRPLF